MKTSNFSPHTAATSYVNARSTPTSIGAGLHHDGSGGDGGSSNVSTETAAGSNDTN